MLKLVHCITKKPEMTGEALFHYSENVHGPIGARVPGLRLLYKAIASVSPAMPGTRTSTAWLSGGSMT
jgi:hypothetical protein